MRCWRSLRGINAGILRELVAKAGHGHRLGGGTGQRRGDDAGDLGNLRLAHGLEDGAGACAILGGIISLGACALQNMEVEGCVAILVEAHGRRAGLDFVIEFGARPVDHRHEVVADDGDVAGGDGFEAGNPGLDLGFALPPMRFTASGIGMLSTTDQTSGERPAGVVSISDLRSATSASVQTLPIGT